MISRSTRFRTVRLSLSDLAGREYVEAVCRARSSLSGEPASALRALAERKVNFYPRELQERLLAILPRVGMSVVRGLASSAAGATTRMFAKATHTAAAPLSGLGYYRVGEDGRLFLISKGEHYHASVGHSFPGYVLVEHARRLGIPNATHNNTRGHITRRLEEELVRTAAGLSRGDRAGLAKVLGSTKPRVLNRVLNLETGSLVVEAAIKMILGRFYRLQEDSPPPKYELRAPVLIVMADDGGGLSANYHGTTITTQLMRGQWSGLRAGLEKQGLLLVRSVRPNDIGQFEATLRRYDAGRHKVAGFVHEFILMNYGGRRLDEKYVRRAYEFCRRHDVPTVADEIQSCLWAPGFFSFREYGVQPTFVAVGKGFPGGEYPAARLLFSADMDCLPQFGALVTNGQEELASLSYLVTMRWAEENAAVTRAVGDYYQARLGELADRYPRQVSGIDGSRHMGAIRFRDLDSARQFVKRLSEGGIDISVQSYKVSTPPVALTKLPLVAGYEVVDFVVDRMHEALLAID